MRVKFLIPKNKPSIRAIQERSESKANTGEGPVYSATPRKTERNNFQKGGKKSARYSRAEESKESTKRSNRFNMFKSPTLPKRTNVFARSRKIETAKISSRSQDFGSFEDIVSLSNEGLDITNVNQAKKMLRNTGLVPVTFKFFIDTTEVKNRKITSAEVSFEKPSDEKPLPTYTGTVINPTELNLEFHQAGARRKQKILQTVYVNFENVYDLNEDIEYNISMSPTRLKILENIPAFLAGNFISKVIEEPVQIPKPVDRIVESYGGQYRNWSLGKTPDPGSEINALPSTFGSSLSHVSSGISKSLVGTDIFLNAGNQNPVPAGPTGLGILDNKMSISAASLVARTSDVRTKTLVGFRSRLMPVIVTANIPQLKYNSNLQIRVRLKSSNTMADQVVAAGSKIYKIEDKYRVCLLPIEAPSIKAVAQGSGLVEVVAHQNDDAGSHVTMFGKFFNKNGSANGGWIKLKTFKCVKNSMAILNLSHYDYDFAALRAVATNGVGYGSKYSAVSVKNWRPTSVSEADSIVGSMEEMPIIFALNNGTSCRLMIKNLDNCKQVTVIREDLSTGKVNRVASSLNRGRKSLTKFDKTVRIGATYRYYLIYKASEAGETNLISYKDDLYTHSEHSPESAGLDIKNLGYDTSTGTDLPTSDDSVSIRMRVNLRKKGMKAIVKMLDNSGITGLTNKDAAAALKNFDKLFASRTSRTNLKTGKKEILAMTPIDLDKGRFTVLDAVSTREIAVDRNISGPIPGDEYVYLTRFYYTDFASLLGRDTTSETPVQNPGLDQSIIKDPSRRFFVTSNTLRSILPSEDFVQNDENYNDVNDGFERNFTGIEIVTTVKIPEDNNFIRNVTVTKITDQVVTVAWELGGDQDAVDHFVILEKSFGKIIPVGAKIAFTTIGKHTFHVTEHESEFDKTYIVKAYDNKGREIASEESGSFIPVSPIPSDIMRVHSLKSLRSIASIRNVLL